MRLLDDLHASCLQLRPLSHMCGPKKPQTPLWETRPVTQMPQLVLNRHAEHYTHFYESAREQKHRGQKTLPWGLSLDQKSRYSDSALRFRICLYTLEPDTRELENSPPMLLSEGKENRLMHSPYASGKSTL